jgi:cytoskeletal protein CcmA (bactofilin family)
MSTQPIPKLDEIRAQKLIDLAHQRFSDHLHEAEERALRDSARSTAPMVDDNCERPAVRAKFIRWMIGDEEAHNFIDPRGVRIWCATIADEVSLSDCRIPFPLDFRRCDFAEPLSLVAAETRQISLMECTVRKGIRADRAVIHGAFVMRFIESSGEIRLHGAGINGHFECSGSQIVVSGNAITLDQAAIRGNVLLRAREEGALRKQFHSSGCIHMNGTSVQGDVECAGAILQLGPENKEESALCLDRTTIRWILGSCPRVSGKSRGSGR